MQLHPYGGIIARVGYITAAFLRGDEMYFPRIEDLRTENDKTQMMVAEYLNLNREVYRRYEKGQREIPVWAVIRLAELYGVSVDYILGLSDDTQRHA